ncbi:unnamed protein product [Prorocentrum cordatum]|uniref:Uncharacterized protein n=1 Tax=Prorocentrum cordatum TaxID=2364126 RepID=A0ABN9X106_9DINO|nr:unnamed protein product [Polarella glacialis]
MVRPRRLHFLIASLADHVRMDGPFLRLQLFLDAPLTLSSAPLIRRGMGFRPPGPMSADGIEAATSNAFATQMEAVRAEVSGIMGSARNDMRDAIVGRLRPRAARLDQRGIDVRQVEDRTTSLETQKGSLLADMDQVQRSLAQARAAAAAGAVDLARLATRDRPPDPSIFRIGRAQPASEADVKNGISQWINDTGPAHDQCSIHGQLPGKVHGSELTLASLLHDINIQYKLFYSDCPEDSAGCAELEELDINSKWLRVKGLMHVAAALARDGIQQGIAPPANAGATGLESATPGAISRAVRRRDARLARRLRGPSQLAEHLGISGDGLARIIRAPEFREAAVTTNWQRFEGVAQEAARASGRRSRAHAAHGGNSPAGVRGQTSTQQTPTRRRLMLSGPKRAQGGRETVAREPTATAATKEHWGPIFAETTRSETDISQCLGNRGVFGDCFLVRRLRNPELSNSESQLTECCFASKGKWQRRSGRQVVLSSLVSLFQATISSHIQQQARQALLQMLQREASRWNSDVWRSVMLVVPESLISRGLRWIDTHIPPEGLPI